MEIIRTGNLARIDHERTEDVEVTKIFQGIYGVGKSYSSCLPLFDPFVR
jgi:DNA polymerase lambda